MPVTVTYTFNSGVEGVTFDTGGPRGNLFLAEIDEDGAGDVLLIADAATSTISSPRSENLFYLSQGADPDETITPVPGIAEPINFSVFNGAADQLENGNIAIVAETAGGNLRWKLVSASGDLVSPATNLGNPSAHDQSHADIVALSGTSGSFLVAYEGRKSTTTTDPVSLTDTIVIDTEIRFKIVDSETGAETDFAVDAAQTVSLAGNTPTGVQISGVSVTQLDGGNIVLAWTANNNSAGTTAVKFKIVAADGSDIPLQGVRTLDANGNVNRDVKVVALSDGGVGFFYEEGNGAVTYVRADESGGNQRSFSVRDTGGVNPLNIEDLDVTRLPNGLLLLGAVDRNVSTPFMYLFDPATGQTLAAREAIGVPVQGVSPSGISVANFGLGGAMLMYDATSQDLAAPGPFSTGEAHKLVRTSSAEFGSGAADTITGDDFIDVMFGRDGDDSLNGGANDDFLHGGSGEDALIGGSGRDRMFGGSGDDGYQVDDAGDEVIEVSNDGTDIVFTSASWVAAAGQEIEFIQAKSTSGAIDVTGNEIGQGLIGNDAANTLDGKDGADTMNGQGGDDRYFVDDAGDQVIEAAGGGNDRVFASVSYALGAGEEIERLETTDGTGTAAINLTGNAFAQTLIGNNGANTLDGKGGADVMRGLGGINRYFVDNAGDQVFEAANGGVNDSVFTSVSYVLATGQEIESITISNGIGSEAINLTGNEFGQKFFGNNGVNTLDGKGGADEMTGYFGDDTYFVDNALDKVIEAAGQGNDRVFASVKYTLGAGQSIERLDTTSATGTGGINLTGNNLAQIIVGNAGVNTLDGRAGADSLYGLGGSDNYIVDSALDRVFESLGGGTDRVFASVSYTLGAGQEFEILSTTSVAGTAAFNLTGNAFAQLILGNAGKNVLDGKAGADRMQGLFGDDTYIVDNAGDVVIEAAGGGIDRVFTSVGHVLAAGQAVESLATTNSTLAAAINLTGNDLGQSILGNAGANVIDGKAGADILNGLGGADRFVFSTALGPANVDRILSFETVDVIALSRAVFSTLAPGTTLAAGAFAAGAGLVAARDASDRIVYDTATGALRYDADGAGGAAAVQVATLQNKPAFLNQSDFLIIA